MQTLDVLACAELGCCSCTSGCVLNAKFKGSEAVQLNAFRVLQLILHSLDELADNRQNIAFLNGTVSLHEEGSDKPYVTVGTKVKKGQCICQIEAMKMYNSIPAPEGGEVISVDVENGSIVEFGTVIARIRKD